MSKSDRRGRLLLLFASLILVMLVGCGSQDAPAQAIERYLQAVIAKDPDRAVTSSCAAWEEQARQEIDSFQAVDIVLKDASCTTTGDDGDAKLVSCQGVIVATYNNENREIALDGKTYRTAFEGGEWRMCGYK
jgi:hypothetical protein